MPKSFNSKQPSDRNFGWVFAVFFFLVALFPLISQSKINVWAFVVSITFAMLAAIKPSLLSPMNYLWFKFGLILHSITSPVALGAIFFLVITPTAILARVFNKEFLSLRFDSKIDSYWVCCKKYDCSKHSFKNQF